jgi:hypothetical protein
MESDMTFVGPEGVYSFMEEHKPTGHTIQATPGLYPTRLSTAVVRFPPSKSSQGLGSLLGVGTQGRKDRDKDKDSGKAKDKEADTASVSSSDTDASPDISPTPDPSATSSPPPGEPASLFAAPHAPGFRKKAAVASRPKHNMKTTSSTFIARLHTAEGLARALQAKSGEVTFLFYNSAKSFFWTEAGAKVKVCPFAYCTGAPSS